MEEVFNLDRTCLTSLIGGLNEKTTIKSDDKKMPVKTDDKKKNKTQKQREQTATENFLEINGIK